MKHRSIHSKMTISVTILTLITCWNGSVVDSNSKDKRLDVNFYGTLQDHSDTIINGEDFAIGDKYKQIAVYPVPKTIETTATSTSSSSRTTTATKPLEMDPKTNKVLIDLHDIASIEPRYPDKPIEHEIEINKNKYIEIVVTLINGSKQNYLIESSRELSCFKVDHGLDKNTKPILTKHKLNMIHVKNLTIKGKKAAEDVNESRIRKDMENSDKVEIAKNTEEILDQIQTKVEDLSSNETLQHDSQYERFKQSIISLLRSLRDQLQKMLSMIKS